MIYIKMSDGKKCVTVKAERVEIEDIRGERIALPFFLKKIFPRFAGKKVIALRAKRKEQSTIVR